MNPAALTLRQRAVRDLLDEHATILDIARKLHLGTASVRSAIYEIRMKLGRDAAPFVHQRAEASERLPEIEAKLTANGRCDRCGLLEPHECVVMETRRSP